MRHIYGLSIVLCALLLVSACAAPGQGGGAAANEETVTVQRGTLRLSVSGSGTVQPARSADVTFNGSGTVADVFAREGATVRRGQVLARLETDVLEAQRDAAEAQRDAAQAQLDRIEEAEEDEEDGTAQLGANAVDTSEAGKRQAEAQLRQAEAQLRQAELNLENATLRTPFDGTVTAVNVAPGDSAAGSVSPTGGGGAPFTVADTSSYYIEANISEADIAQIEEGQSAEVTLDALDTDPISGTVSYIAPAATIAQNVATYVVRVDLPDEIEGLRIGMSASVEINQDEREDVLLIPSSAVRTEGNRRIVRVQQGEQFIDREIQTGLSNDLETEVTGGLNEGDVIAAIGVAETE